MLADLTANDAGYITGQVVVWVLLLAGVWKCWSIARRPTTNWKCAISLLCFFGLLIESTFLRYLSQSFRSLTLLHAFRSIFGLVFVGTLVCGIVLAILGLTEYSRQKDRFTQGRAQAIWALVLLSLVLVCSLISMAFAPVRQISRSRSSRPGELLTFEDFNFSFRAPSRDWAEFDAAKLNQASKLGFTRSFPETYFFLIPERIGEREFSSQQLVEIGKARLAATADSSKIDIESVYEVNGLKGVLVETEAHARGYSLHYVHWYYATNGYSYQLVAYGRSQDSMRVSAEARTLFSSFRVIDPARVATAPGGFLTNFVSTRYSYSVQLTNSSWRPYANLRRSFPDAEFGATSGESDSSLFVFPVSLGGQKVDPEMLSAAMLQLINVSAGKEPPGEKMFVTNGALSGAQFDFTREINDVVYTYRFRVFSGFGNAYLIAAMTKERDAHATAILMDAVERVTIVGLKGSNERGAEFSQAERKVQGFVLNSAGLHHFEKAEYEKALPLFCAAAQANDRESLYVVNALETWNRLDRPAEALAYLGKQGPPVWRSQEVRAWQAFLQVQDSQPDAAVTNYAALFANGYRNDNHFVQYVRLLNSQQQFETALAEEEKYLEKKSSDTVLLIQADTYRLKGDFAKAIRQLALQYEKTPSNMQVAGSLTEAHLQAGHYKEALEISTDMLKRSSESAYGYFLKGRSQLGLKWFREARESLEAAAKLAPASKEISSYLDHVRTFTGEGNLTGARELIAPVIIPAALTNDLPHIPEEYGKTYGAYYPYRIQAVSWEKGKEHKTTDFLLARVLDSSGIASFSTFQVPFDPLFEQIYVNALRIQDLSGKTISEGNPSDYYVLDASSDPTVSQKKILNVPVPGLQPGCEIALTITRRDFGHRDEFQFVEHSFSRSVPVRKSMFFLSGPTNGLIWRTSRGIKAESLSEGTLWSIDDPLIVRWEPLQPPVSRYGPMLWISDAAANWHALASNYLALIQDKLEVDPAIQKLARQLIGEAKRDNDKVAILANYVQTNCVYKALEFGRRGRIPNKPADILRSKYGDCKDHAVLLQQLLEAAGLRARLALVNHQNEVQAGMPSLDQFNHMIVCLAIQGNDRFIDCTDKGSDVGREVPYGLAGREALVLDASEPRLVRIPAYPENASSIEIEKQVRLLNLTDLNVQQTMTLKGIHGGYLRDVLLRMPEASRRPYVQRQFGLSEIELADFKAEPLDTPGAPLRITCAYTLKRQFRRSADSLGGILPVQFERSYLGIDPADRRETPFEISIPFSLRSTIHFDVPDGFCAEALANLRPRFDPRFAKCESRSQIEGKRLNLEFQFFEPVGFFKPSDYPAYRESMTQALSLLQREVVFKNVEL